MNTSLRYTHLRLNLFPDGGVARLKVHGIVERSWDDLPVRFGSLIIRGGGRRDRAELAAHMGGFFSNPPFLLWARGDSIRFRSHSY